MLKRLLVGVVIGLVIGGVVAAALVEGLGMPFFASPLIAYVAAAVTGVLTGLVAGKPIWSSDGAVEAGLKAFFGTLLALFGMFALRQWTHITVDLSALKAGTGQLGDLPATSLPLIAVVLAGFFEADNTPASDNGKRGASASAMKRLGSKMRVADENADDEDEVESAQKKGKTR
ncbi:MAG: hypothetical protein FWD69_00135 [Polyangiaceae bacterium]|nr:hypothetical protein [Polyangiaceae bacterium]